MIRSLLIVFMVAVTTVAGLADSTMAQQRISDAKLEELKTKLETQRDAYYRLEMAEQEAAAEGSQERASIYAAAKAKAYEKYLRQEAEFRKAQMEKREQDNRMAQNAPEYR